MRRVQAKADKPKRRPIIVDPEIAAMANIIAIAEQTTVAAVCRPHLFKPIKKRFEQLPDPFKQMLPRPDADATSPPTPTES